MKAVVYDRYGAPEVLRLSEVPVPVAGDGEVLVRLGAVSVNLSDWETLTGRPAYARLNGLFRPRKHILGSDVAGRVAAVGAGVTRFAVGDDVFGDLLDGKGGFAEFVRAPEGSLAAIPRDMSYDEASALPQAAAIALHGIRRVGKVQPGQAVLINGAFVSTPILLVKTPFREPLAVAPKTRRPPTNTVISGAVKVSCAALSTSSSSVRASDQPDVLR